MVQVELTVSKRRELSNLVKSSVPQPHAFRRTCAKTGIRNLRAKGSKATRGSGSGEGRISVGVGGGGKGRE